MLGVKYNNTTSRKIDGWLKSTLDNSRDTDDIPTKGPGQKHEDGKIGKCSFDGKVEVKNVNAKNG